MDCSFSSLFGLSPKIKPRPVSLALCEEISPVTGGFPSQRAINTRQRQNGCYFPDDIFKCIFLKKTILILINISLKFVPAGPINNIPALVKIMAWHRLGDKPLSAPMMVLSLLTHICVTRPQWVNANNVSLSWCAHAHKYRRRATIFLAATKQLYKWYFPSVCHTFLTMFPSSYHHEIFRSYYQWPK